MVDECNLLSGPYKAILRQAETKEQKFRLKMNLKDKLIMEPKIIKLRNLLCKN